MSERGYSDIEKFKDDIEKAHSDKAEIERLYRERQSLIRDLQDELKKKPALKSTVFNIQYELPIFTEKKGPATVTKVNGSKIMERRQHSYLEGNHPVIKLATSNAEKHYHEDIKGIIDVFTTI